MFILLPFISWIFCILLVTLTFFESTWALYLYLIFSLIIVWYTYIVSFWAKRKIRKTFSFKLDSHIEEYATFLLFPFASKILSMLLNSVRWTWVFMLIAILMFDWISSYFAIIPVLIFFSCGSISVNLDPIFFLSNAINNWQSEFIWELERVEYYLSIINSEHS